MLDMMANNIDILMRVIEVVLPRIDLRKLKWVSNGDFNRSTSSSSTRSFMNLV